MEKLRVLIACEWSGVVRDRFRERGFEAWSCDLLPSERPGLHYEGDLFDIIDQGWAGIIAFPECTHLSGAGAPSWPEKQADGRQQAAIDFVKRIYENDCPMIAVENPTGILNTVWRKPNQIVNPNQFGDPFKKRTCFWLKGLPCLQPTNVVEPRYHYTSNSTRGGPRADGTRKKSSLPIFKPWMTAKERGQTFPGIADAMADQWGAAILSAQQGE